MAQKRRRFRRRQLLGQFRIEGLLDEGGFAEVYKAYDTVEGIRVALKIPHDRFDASDLAAFQREVRLLARLEHPNILAIKTATRIDGHFVVVTALGEESLYSRLKRRVGRATVLDVTSQLLAALSYAHEKRIVHCDVKPENVILFRGGRVKLGDFGLARVALRSIDASGSGTLGYMAPEQALGRPSLRSDVFSAGMILYRMMAGEIPRWPFKWPYPNAQRARRNYPRELVDFVRKATAIDQRKRFASAVPMRAEFERIRRRLERGTGRRSRSAR